ncbi:MAG: DUF2461 domain-containing protein [Spirochaetales bacterium]|nr:DUF2461 domain-containing protein [Spirochaetales bacterium]
MIVHPGFPKQLFTFLKKLAANNDREWFNAHKDEYVRYAKEPTVQFIVAMKDRLANVSSSYIADPRGNGGSMFRIYRDTRFSKDKKPYKENIGCHFRHVAGKDAHAPGFYVHLEPGGSMAGGGIWLPPTPVLNKIRDAIDQKQDEWLKVKGFIEQSDNIEVLDGQRLKRPPQGFAANHPLIEDLKMKTFFSGRHFKDSEVASAEFIDMVEKTFQDMVPLMRFINEALGLSF